MQQQAAASLPPAPDGKVYSYLPPYNRRFYSREDARDRKRELNCFQLQGATPRAEVFPVQVPSLKAAFEAATQYVANDDEVLEDSSVGSEYELEEHYAAIASWVGECQEYDRQHGDEYMDLAADDGDEVEEEEEETPVAAAVAASTEAENMDISDDGIHDTDKVDDHDDTDFEGGDFGGEDDEDDVVANNAQRRQPSYDFLLDFYEKQQGKPTHDYLFAYFKAHHGAATARRTGASLATTTNIHVNSHVANTPGGSDDEAKEDEMEENRDESAPNGESGTDSSNKRKERDNDDDDDEQDTEGGSNSNPGSNDGTQEEDPPPTYQWFLDLWNEKRELFDLLLLKAPRCRTGEGPTADDEDCKAYALQGCRAIVEYRNILGNFEDRDRILGPYSGNAKKTYNALWRTAIARLFWGYATGKMSNAQPKYDDPSSYRIKDFMKAKDHDDYPSENERKCFDFIMENLDLSSLEKATLLESANAAGFAQNIKNWGRNKKDVSDRIKVIMRDLLVGMDLVGFLQLNKTLSKNGTHTTKRGKGAKRAKPNESTDDNENTAGENGDDDDDSGTHRADD